MTKHIVHVVALTLVATPLLLGGCGGDDNKGGAGGNSIIYYDGGGGTGGAKLDGASTIDSASSDVSIVLDGKSPVDTAGLDVSLVPDAPAPIDSTAIDGTKTIDTLACAPSLPIVHISQGITTATTWTTGKVYVIDGSIVISATLTIQPGVVVKFTKGPAISFGQGGGIVADGGSPATPIVFTSIKDDAHGGDTNGDCAATLPAPGDWAAIKISYTNSSFNYCQFLYGGSSKPYSGAVSVNNDGTAKITNCTFAYNDGGALDDTRAAALNVGGGAASTTVTGNTFYGNVIPLVISGLLNIDNTNVFHQPTSVAVDAGAGVDAGAAAVTNKYNGIFMDGVSHAVNGAVTWSNVEVPYVLYDTVLSINDGGSLTLATGVVVKSAKAGRIDVANLGTLTSPTGSYFTSFLDDSLLGDTNGDGSTTSPAKGDWVGVNLCKPLCSYASWANVLYAAHP